MPVRVPPAPSFPGVAQEIGCTTVTTVAELLEATKTGVGAAVMVTLKSAAVAGSTRIVVTAVLLVGRGSAVWEVTVAEFWIVVPAAVPALTCSLKESVAVVPPGASARLYVQMMGPVPAFAGFVQVQLVELTRPRKLVFAGVC